MNYAHDLHPEQAKLVFSIWETLAVSLLLSAINRLLSSELDGTDMNSFLQSLYMTDPFCWSILRGQFKRESSSILSELQRLFAFLSWSQRSAIRPTSFLKVRISPKQSKEFELSLMD
jgi:hypothetical protein